MIYKLNPVLKEYIWAGEKLKTKYNKKTDRKKISESFEFSVLKDNESTFKRNSNEVKLNEVVDSKMLIKLIDSSSDLSIQVHPSDEYALKNYNKLGKKEYWYILSSEENAFIYLGFNKNYTKDEVIEAISNNTICNLLNKYYVKPGELYTINPGTVHAIGSNVTLYEIQESSDLTFRLYDYDRVDKDGKKRELHIKEAMDVINFNKYEAIKNDDTLLVQNEYFDLMKININGYNQFGSCKDKYSCLTLIEGRALINDEVVLKGESILVEPKTIVNIGGVGEALIAISK